MQPSSESRKRTLLANGRIFDGRSPQLSEPKFVSLCGDRIEHIDRERPVATFDVEVDLGGKILMPGLIDAHFHAFATEIDTAKCETYPVTYQSHRARLNLEGALRRGFTTVRDVAGGDHGTWLASEEQLFPLYLRFVAEGVLQAVPRAEPPAAAGSPCPPRIRDRRGARCSGRIFTNPYGCEGSNPHTQGRE